MLVQLIGVQLVVIPAQRHHLSVPTQLCVTNFAVHPLSEIVSNVDTTSLDREDKYRAAGPCHAQHILLDSYKKRLYKKTTRQEATMRIVRVT
jgi:hypothetical protein